MLSVLIVAVVVLVGLRHALPWKPSGPVLASLGGLFALTAACLRARDGHHGNLLGIVVVWLVAGAISHRLRRRADGRPDPEAPAGERKRATRSGQGVP